MKIAIIGASKNKEKHSNQAVRLYKNNDHVVFPVNPNEREIEGLKCYNSVQEVPLDIDLVAIFLPPELGLKVVDNIIQKGIKKVHLNPGCESQEIIENFKSNKINVSVKCSIKHLESNLKY